ncbi:MAG: hypothetical protein ACRC1P_11720 [Cellulosilyticaceae bacterium]
MKIGERFQYKLRNYIYDIERSKKQKQTLKKRTDNDEQKGLGQIGQMLDEMDDYLGELFENLPHKKDSKRKN